MYQERRARSMALPGVRRRSAALVAGPERVAQGPGPAMVVNDVTPAGEAGARHKLPALDPAPVVAHEVNRPLRKATAPANAASKSSDSRSRW